MHFIAIVNYRNGIAAANKANTDHKSDHQQEILKVNGCCGNQRCQAIQLTYQEQLN